MPSKHEVAGSNPAGIAIPHRHGPDPSTGERRSYERTRDLADLSTEALVWLAASHARALAFLTVLALVMFLPGFVSLQPMDRDEPRFAQASRQMLETGDFVDIRFQDEARHKKPVGIYWMQAAAVAVAEEAGLADARRTIAVYRLPSLAGAVLTVLLTYWTALAFVSRRGALIAAALMAASLLLGVEARLAKTDAVLTAMIVGAMGALARVWFRTVSPGTVAPVRLATVVLFWLALAIGILVKGPIAPMIVALAILALVVVERSWRWLGALRPGLGLLIMGVIVLPWLVAIAIESGGGFFEASLGRDMLAKVGSGVENHWGPPGLYATAFWATAWPAAPLVALAFRFAWRERKDDAVLFLLAWVLPAWLIFEAVPTKLPHYVLPLYPALAILAVMAIEREAIPFHWRSARLAALLLLLVPAALLVAVPVASWQLDGGVAWVAFPLLALAFVFAMAGTAALIGERPRAALAPVLASAFLVYVATYPFGMARLESINLSKRLAAAADGVACTAPAIGTAGYNEPSLVFLTGTRTVLGLDGRRAAQFFGQPGCRIAFVERRHEPAFVSAVAGIAEKPSLVTRVAGFNINGGRRLDIGVYARDR